MVGRAQRALATVCCVLLCAVGLGVVGSGPAGADGPLVSQSITDRGVTLELVPLFELPDTDRGVARPTHFAVAGDRFFVAEEHTGKIYEIDRDGRSATISEFFDVGDSIEAATGRSLNTSNSFHGGLRGIAFHPDFETNGLFYTALMEDRPAQPDLSNYVSNPANPLNVDSVVVEWTADVVTGVVGAGSYRPVLRIGIAQFDHPIKEIAFNRFAQPGDTDYGLLYVGHGDGSFESNTVGGGQGNNGLGKILRINPVQSGAGSYSIPSDNPFVGDPSMPDEVYSLGHRNPQNFAFAESGNDVVLLVAEPGRDNVEEVNVIESGSDYGWSEREGTFVQLDEGGGLVLGVQPLPADEATNGYTFPAIQYGHRGETGAGFAGQAIAGGFVVNNGSELSGEYFFADFPKTGDIYHSSLDDIVGAVTELDPNVPSRDEPGELTQAEISFVSVVFDHDANPDTAPLERDNARDVFNDSANYEPQSDRADLRFGQGPDGELYVSSKKNGGVYLVTNSVQPELIQILTCDDRIVTVDLASGESPTDGDDVIIGTPITDTIDGLGGNDVICGGGGDDFINGGAGNDRILGEAGNDKLAGGSGNDTVIANNGNDQLFGGSGDDFLDGGAGNDVLAGAAGNDIIAGGSGADRVLGGADDDTISGGTGSDKLFGLFGNDIISGGSEPDLISGGAGEDVVAGGAGNDFVAGGADDDRVLGGTGNDRLRGGLGADRMFGLAGLDDFDGGDGQDQCVSDSAAEVRLSCELI